MPLVPTGAIIAPFHRCQQECIRLPPRAVICRTDVRRQLARNGPAGSISRCPLLGGGSEATGGALNRRD